MVGIRRGGNICGDSKLKSYKLGVCKVLKFDFHDNSPRPLKGSKSKYLTETEDKRCFLVVVVIYSIEKLLYSPLGVGG